MKDLLKLGLDLNCRAPNSIMTIWGFIVNCLIQDPHTLLWEIVRYGLESGLPEPSWEVGWNLKFLKLMFGSSTYTIMWAWQDLYRPCWFRFRPLVFEPEVTMSLRPYLGVHTDNCGCTRGENDDTEWFDMFTVPPLREFPCYDSYVQAPDEVQNLTTSCYCRHANKDDREAILKLLDERDASYQQCESRGEPEVQSNEALRDTQGHRNPMSPTEQPAIPWRSWGIQSAIDNVSFWLYRYRATRWIVNPVVPWVLVAIFGAMKIKSFRKGA
ncbi:hypothetical protein QBC40DRAFT_78871 [Triangularia verruculosa]|uniref:Uncharacterized protein n=1 Tax=Triangularia verruculosa TaxID=2587418 RepID=A0AAN7AWC5_9PEZI|nr:hypothetical protein QBC40DRAFT_78871 [Triangularia verruculosa]